MLVFVFASALVLVLVLVLVVVVVLVLEGSTLRFSVFLTDFRKGPPYGFYKISCISEIPPLPSHFSILI